VRELSEVRWPEEDVKRMLKGIQEEMKKNESLLFDTICNLNDCAFKINLKKGVTPVFIKQYLIVKSMKTKVAERVGEWEEAGWIVKADKDCSNWNIPLLPARKKSSGIVNPDNIKLCLNFKRVNAITKPFQYMIPVIKEISTKIEGKRYLTKLDIKSAFYYILLVEESHQVVTFTTPDRHKWK
jgi:hypothetical protein